MNMDTNIQKVVQTGSAYIDVPPGAEITLIANDDIVGWTFNSWIGNFEAAGVTDLNPTLSTTTFTMVNSDINAEAKRSELGKYAVYPTNAIGPGGRVYPGTYAISGNLVNNDNYHYTFTGWSCIDILRNNCISAIAAPDQLNTTITVTDKDLWIIANYTTHYKLTVIQGQDTGDGYYYNGETINTVYANTPSAESGLQFDHWEDPMGVIQNIYDPTPVIRMKNSIATITAVFTSIGTRGNSAVITGEELSNEVINRSQTSLINGVFAIGTLVFDRDGCIGIITELDPDHNDDTDDFKTEKLFYGGNV